MKYNRAYDREPKLSTFQSYLPDRKRPPLSVCSGGPTSRWLPAKDFMLYGDALLLYSAIFQSYISTTTLWVFALISLFAKLSASYHTEIRVSYNVKLPCKYYAKALFAYPFFQRFFFYRIIHKTLATATTYENKIISLFKFRNMYSFMKGVLHRIFKFKKIPN